MTKKRSRTYSIGGKHGANCDEFLALLNEYVDGKVGASTCKKLESHLAQCNPCRVVVDNIRKTITLYRRNQPCALPVKFRKRLYAELRTCWGQSGPPRKKG